MRSFTKPLRLTALYLAAYAVIVATGCQKQATEKQAGSNGGTPGALSRNNGNGWGNISPETVLLWNEAATNVVIQTQLAIPAPIPPFLEARFYAMTNIAMHDALNSIVPKYKTYALQNNRSKKADPDAAVAKAAYDVITYFFGKLNPPALATPPAVQDHINNLLAETLDVIPDGDSKTMGLALGAAAAQAIIANRSNDGSDQVSFPVTAGTTPGAYRFTAPFDGPPFNGFYHSPGWGDVRPFGIESSTQFPVPPPYPITSAEYTADYNEIKMLGCATCTGAAGRTPDQEALAKFWVENSPYGWYKVALQLVAQRHMDAWKAARLFALLQMTESDTYVASLKAKMIFFFWRPVTAIQLGDSDGNPNTAGDPSWQVLVFPTPPIADHPSGHATAGGGAAELLKQFFGKDNFSFSFESTTLPGTARQFTSLSQAAEENSLSRIYVGYHFRKAVLDGEALGRKIGAWVYSHSLQEN